MLCCDGHQPKLAESLAHALESFRRPVHVDDHEVDVVWLNELGARGRCVGGHGAVVRLHAAVPVVVRVRGSGRTRSFARLGLGLRRWQIGVRIEQFFKMLR